jgi:hypothetical protein
MRWVGLELLAGPGLFGRAGPRLRAGYVGNTIGREPKPWHRLDARAILSVVAQRQAEPAPAVGLGRGVLSRQPRAGRRHPGGAGASGPPHGVPRRGGVGCLGGPVGESIRAHGRPEKTRARAIIGLHASREPARPAMAAPPADRPPDGHRRRGCRAEARLHRPHDLARPRRSPRRPAFHDDKGGDSRRSLRKAEVRAAPRAPSPTGRRRPRLVRSRRSWPANIGLERSGAVSGLSTCVRRPWDHRGTAF